ncbi:MAG: helix-turn-helix transcriptional regulator [Ekhidna sp.]|nr:helix-turn-helix transcriptional regulator [Ekhidna sp.]MBC6408985.1 helix-turn-helix transcriptional regulator [Ekhidna sp.]MBC6425694.1 helix-turn-helix transcriptional regulator [Ekhidna sp.]
MKESFGKYLKNLRVRKEMTLTQLGAKLGIDSGALSKIENGKRKLDERVLPEIAKIFNLDLDELKDEFISELIAHKIYENNCTDKVLKLAEEKVEYIKQRNFKQGNLDL